MSHKWNYFVCAKSELYTYNDYWITRMNGKTFHYLSNCVQPPYKTSKDGKK